MRSDHLCDEIKETLDRSDAYMLVEWGKYHYYCTMRPNYFTTAGATAYQPARLIMKLAPAGAAPLAAFRGTTRAAGAAAAPAAPATSGLSALARFEKAGLIKKVIPLSRRAEAAATRGPLRAMAGIAASVHDALEKDPHVGVSIIELEDDAHVEELRTALADDPMVDYAARVPIRYLLARRKPSSSRSQSRKATRRKTTIAASAPTPSAMWNLAKIQWATARAGAGFKDAEEIKVAVLDSGIDESHPDLRQRIASYVYKHPDFPTVSGPKDYIGHGTHVAGTIAALINNNVGINGICACQLNIWKIFDDQPDFQSWSNDYSYWVDDVMYRRALADCLDEGVNVINLSIGGPAEPGPDEEILFEQLLAAGTTIVAAMGNEREVGSPVSYPAAIPGVIAVGATNILDRVTRFSNRGEHIALSAPGQTIWSTLPTYAGQIGFRADSDAAGRPRPGVPDSRDTDYAAWDGTSMASPHVAAGAALLLAKHGEMTPADVRDRLRATADRVLGMGTKKEHPDYGTGRLNLLKLLS
jgi:subtilisin family serine protease